MQSVRSTEPGDGSTQAGTDITETKQRGSLPFQHDLQQWAAFSVSGQHRFLILARGSLPKHQQTDYFVRWRCAGEFAQWEQRCSSIWAHEVTFVFFNKRKATKSLALKLSYVIDRLLMQIACNRHNDFWVYFSSISGSFSICIRDPHSVSSEPSFFWGGGQGIVYPRLASNSQCSLNMTLKFSLSCFCLPDC